MQAAIRKPTPLPRLKADKEHFMSYEESCELCDNDERDLPSAKKSAPKELLKQKKALDKEKSSVLVSSNARRYML